VIGRIDDGPTVRVNVSFRMRIAAEAGEGGENAPDTAIEQASAIERFIT
jgi:hypothetical protein